MNALQLRGGYKAYRAWVRRQWSQVTLPPIVALQGMTGVGKTLLLHRLRPIFPEAVVDLEGLAGHRASILGAIGLQPRSQKRFESELLARLSAAGPFLILEGEARRIGDVYLPTPLHQALEEAPQVRLVASLDTRVERLCQEYAQSGARREELVERLEWFRGRLGRVESRFWEALAAGRLAEVAGLLLKRHYDPRYRHAERKLRIVAEVEAEDLGRATLDVAAWIRTHRAAATELEEAAA